MLPNTRLQSDIGSAVRAKVRSAKKVHNCERVLLVLPLPLSHAVGLHIEYT